MSDSSRRTYESRIERIDTVAPETRRFLIERPADFSFRPGQFLSLLLSVGGEVLTKPYTIASSPEDGGPLEIVLNRIAGGLGSGYLFDLSVGSTLRFTGPWGTFFIDEPPNAESIFIAEGTGIAAIRPMVHRVLARSCASIIRLHQAAPTADHLLYREELQEAARVHGRFEYDPLADVSLEPLIESRYVRGDSNRTRHFFICGIGDIVTRLRDLLRRAGYERRAVQYEKW